MIFTNCGSPNNLCSVCPKLLCNQAKILREVFPSFHNEEYHGIANKPLNITVNVNITENNEYCKKWLYFIALVSSSDKDIIYLNSLANFSKSRDIFLYFVESRPMRQRTGTGSHTLLCCCSILVGLVWLQVWDTVAGGQPRVHRHSHTPHYHHNHHHHQHWP